MTSWWQRAAIWLAIWSLGSTGGWAADAGAMATDGNTVDHAALIGAWDPASERRGAELYSTLCVVCHGTPDQPGSLPTSRAFWREPFKNGSDPLSLFRTLTEGFGQMPSWPFLTPTQRYDVIHYVRETFIRPHNPGAYVTVTPAYLAGLPKATGEFRKTAQMIEFERGPQYRRMDFGPALFWTLEVATNNIAYKGIAIRLDPGAGGVSKGRAWVVYDHDTLRVAAAWGGEGFVDWKGIAFDGTHGTHTSILGERVFVNPVGPGWADPTSGRFDDPRLRGRDGRPYGPLPREWARFGGLYRHDRGMVLAYSVDGVEVLEMPDAVLRAGADWLFARHLNVAARARPMRLRVAPAENPVTLRGDAALRLQRVGAFQEIEIPAGANPVRFTVFVARAGADSAAPGRDERTAAGLRAPPDLAAFKGGGASRWNPPVATQVRRGADDGPFAVDELTVPAERDMPWASWMRLTGLDFFRDGRRAAVSTWNGDVWIVTGVGAGAGAEPEQLIWKRVASGLFQPLGVKIVDETIHVTCRDMIARLHDANGDDEIDFIENFNNDHQVTEHFHEFAMGLQTDAAGNFYYAKSARHALTAVVPQHGTLLRVSRDGRTTDIVANGFRAANGVCVNEDGTFFVTDQEGHWTPKNRINRVRQGGFYGNMFGYHDRASAADADMEQPVVWITNEMDRSPGELLRVTGAGWGALRGGLLNLSYGTGRIFWVPTEKVRAAGGGREELDQGGVVALPIPDFPTGVMRGRFHPGDGHLYACGMHAWAGNKTGDGGFYRVRATGKPAYLPVELHAEPGALRLVWSDALDAVSAADATRYAVRVWGLTRSANYGSKHIGEHALAVRRAVWSAEGRVLRLEIPELSPTRGMEIRMNLRTPDGQPLIRVVHNTIHGFGAAGEAAAAP